MKNIDFLIIGQGLAGSLLGYELMKRGHSIHILDQAIENTSSNKAGGLYNPITGRNMVKTWLADDLFPMIPAYYRELETLLQCQFHQELPIYRPFHNKEELNDWMGKEKDKPYLEFVSEISSSSVNFSGLQDEFGGLFIKKSGYVNLPKMIKAFRRYFKSIDAYSKETLNHQELNVENGISYAQLKAQRIIFCEGPRAIDNPWWGDLPFSLIRGEVIDIKCDLQADRIYNRGVFMLPRDGIFRVGSTYDHGNLTYEPQPKSIEELKRRLNKLYSEPYEIITISAGIRPTTIDRRPFIGLHPKNKAVGIFNGFGTKGVSLVPYFSKLFVDSIEGKSKIHKEADVSRVI